GAKREFFRQTHRQTQLPHTSTITRAFPTEAGQDAAAAQQVDLACCPAAACQHTRSPPSRDVWLRETRMAPGK
ncbi:hypothetical protein CIB84_017286, partial [Bambusicola thoracicus]